MAKYVVVGGNVAGVTAAKRIRDLDPGSQVALYSEDPYPYYYRPRLWEYIAGQIQPEDTYYRPVEWYAQQGIDLYLDSCVEQFDPERKTLQLQNGETVGYDRLLIATGGRCFVPPLEGTDLPGVFDLRTLDDAKAIVARAEQVQAAVLIGGGLLGLETAKALSDRGLHVTVVEFFPQLLPRQLDEPGSEVLAAHLSQLGMTLLTGEVTQSIEVEGDDLLVSLKSGKQLRAGLVIFSTGIRSETAVWQAGGIDTNRGIVVNEYLETSLADVFAAGDAAEYQGVVYGIIPAAREQAEHAAANMVHTHSSRYEGTLPSTRLKIAGMEFNALGESTLEGEDVTVLRLSQPAAGRYERIAIRGGVIVGAIVLGDSRRVQPLKSLIAAGVNVSYVQDQLFDKNFDLKSLIQ
jgi:nitrite reductase (NADH) large subunit